MSFFQVVVGANVCPCKTMASFCDGEMFFLDRGLLMGTVKSASVFIEPGLKFVIPQFGANSYYNGDSVQKTDLVLDQLTMSEFTILV